MSMRVTLLGVCTATDIEPLLARHGIDAAATVVEVEKVLGTWPKRLTSLGIVIHLPADTATELLPRIERAARHCVVRRSLALDVEVRPELRSASPT
jgi:uncharacterized OsmC-like protein